MKLHTDEGNEMISHFNGIKSEENTMCNSESTQKTQPSDCSCEKDSKSKVLFAKKQQHYQRFSRMIRMPNEAQFAHYHNYYHGQDRPEKLLARLNLDREPEEDEWTLTDLFATYEILLMGSKLLISKSKIPALTINAFQEVKKSLDSISTQQQTNGRIRKPNLRQFNFFNVQFTTRNEERRSIINFTDCINSNREPGESEWTTINVIATYKLLVMGSRLHKLLSAKLSSQQKDAQTYIYITAHISDHHRESSTSAPEDSTIRSAPNDQQSNTGFIQPPQNDPPPQPQSIIIPQNPQQQFTRSGQCRYAPYRASTSSIRPPLIYSAHPPQSILVQEHQLFRSMDYYSLPQADISSNEPPPIYEQPHEPYSTNQDPQQ